MSGRHFFQQGKLNLQLAHYFCSTTHKINIQRLNKLINQWNRFYNAEIMKSRKI